MTYKQLKITNIQRKLANMGIERLPDEIWEWIQFHSESQEIAMLRLMEIDENDVAFYRFAVSIRFWQVFEEPKPIEYVTIVKKDPITTDIFVVLVIAMATAGLVIGMFL